MKVCMILLMSTATLFGQRCTDTMIPEPAPVDNSTMAQILTNIANGNFQEAWEKCLQLTEPNQVQQVVRTAYKTTSLEQITYYVTGLFNIHFIYGIPNEFTVIEAIWSLIYEMKEHGDIDKSSVFLLEPTLTGANDYYRKVLGTTNQCESKINDIKERIKYAKMQAIKRWATLIVSNRSREVVVFLDKNEGVFYENAETLVKTAFDASQHQSSEILEFAFAFRLPKYSAIVITALHQEMKHRIKISLLSILQVAHATNKLRSLPNYNTVGSTEKKYLSDLWNALPWHIKDISTKTPVCLKNLAAGTWNYLFVKNHFDESRDRVMATPNSKDRKISLKWIFETADNAASFRIKSAEWGDYLYPAADFFAISKEKRRLFTWRGSDVVPAGTWQIQDHDWSNNKFLLFNTHYGEYLNTATADEGDSHLPYDAHNAFTWRGRELGPSPVWILDGHC